MPEQSHFDVIRALIACVISGIARVPTPGDNTIFAPLPTKTAEFEVKNRRKSAEEAKALHLQFVTSVYFSK